MANAYARITDETGDFNECCDVVEADAMVMFGLLQYDGETTPGEHCYSVTDDDTGAVHQFLAEVRGAASRGGSETVPGA